MRLSPASKLERLPQSRLFSVKGHFRDMPNRVSREPILFALRWSSSSTSLIAGRSYVRCAQQRAISLA